MFVSADEAKAMFHASAELEKPVELTPEELNEKREQLRKQAIEFLYNNQECYVAQWILQNPFAKIDDYKLKFEYNDQSLMGYTVTMEKIDV